MTHDPMRQADIARRLANLAKARRCGAKTRAGHPCRQAAVRGRPRCRMHGGAKGSGGPLGGRNGNFKHGVLHARGQSNPQGHAGSYSGDQSPCSSGRPAQAVRVVSEVQIAPARDCEPIAGHECSRRAYEGGGPGCADENGIMRPKRGQVEGPRASNTRHSLDDSAPSRCAINLGHRACGPRQRLPPGTGLSFRLTIAPPSPGRARTAPGGCARRWRRRSRWRSPPPLDGSTVRRRRWAQSPDG